VYVRVARLYWLWVVHLTAVVAVAVDVLAISPAYCLLFTHTSILKVVSTIHNLIDGHNNDWCLLAHPSPDYVEVKVVNRIFVIHSVTAHENINHLLV